MDDFLGTRARNELAQAELGERQFLRQSGEVDNSVSMVGVVLVVVFCSLFWFAVGLCLGYFFVGQ